MPPRGARRRADLAQAGFTLVELMVVTVIIAILASIALPRFNTYLLQGRLEEAKPYLMAIAAAERARYHETGQYAWAVDENDLEDELGVTLSDTGNFCFLVVCHDADVTGDGVDEQSCGTVAGANTDSTLSYIAPEVVGDNDIQFEVWAVLRNGTTAGDNTATYGSTNCVSATDTSGGNDKADSTGWVDTTGLTEVGGEGRVVVLRYPPPPNRLDTATPNYHNTTLHDWVEGLSVKDVLDP